MDKKKKMTIELSMGMPGKTKSAASADSSSAKSGASMSMPSAKGAADVTTQEIPPTAKSYKAWPEFMNSKMSSAKDASTGDSELDNLDKEIEKKKKYKKTIEEMMRK